MTGRVARCLLSCAAAAWLAAFSRPAAAQDDVSRADIALQNQVLELRHDLDALRDQVAGGNGVPQTPQTSTGAVPAGAGGDALAALLDRETQLEDQVRTLQGHQDELTNRLQQQNGDLAKQIGDLNFRLQALEGKGGATVPGGTPPPDVPPPVAATRPPAAALPGHATLQEGYAALARRDYPAAEASARDTLANPRAPHAYDAQFLLAQSLAGQHNYQQAALAYDDTYAKSRRGPHAEDALIGLAGSLAALGAKPASCATLDKLHSEFPAARADVRASASAIARRTGCR